jgi:hypothetical protein
VSPDTITLTLEAIVLRWALIFFIMPMIAAVFGVGGIAGEAAWIGRSNSRISYPGRGLNDNWAEGLFRQFASPVWL